MSKDEAMKEMARLVDCTDAEEAHYDADDILCSLLTALGHRDLIELYSQVPKWYA